MFHRKKFFKGAISIFLVIILVSNYALVGLLVDSARQRMARASSEMALDTAAASVLSYYDQMVYDLYGLFATDNLSNAEIERLLSDYVQKSLGTVSIEPSEAKKLTNTIVSAIWGTDQQRVDSILFDGYNYEFGTKVVSFNSKDSVSLAYTDAVKAQIIDHMKYRAPRALSEEAGSFLKDLQGVLEMADRLNLAITKMSEEKKSKDKERLSQEAASLISDIEAYNKKALVFSAIGRQINSSEQGRSLDGLQTSFTSPYDPWVTINALDKKFDEIGNSYTSLDPADEDYEEKATQMEEDLRTDYEAAYQDFLEDWQDVGDIAARLYDEANSLRDRADTLNTDFNAYIAKLQAKINADPNNENVKTLYLPEIELAETTCGEALKNMYLVLTGRQYCMSLRDAFQKNNQAMGGFTDTFIEGAVNQIIDNRLGNNPNATTAKLSTFIKNETSNPFAQQANGLMDNLSNDFNKLFQEADEYEDPTDVQLKTNDAAPSAETVTKKEDDEKEDLRDLDKDDLLVNFKSASKLDKEWDAVLSDSMDTDNTLELLQAGKRLLSDISDVLNNARDSLYINEYIIEYYPNYVQHYNAPDSPLGLKGADLTSKESYYAPFNASQAELEYILSGDPDASRSVLSVSAKLTAVRMIFNTIAIFTDTGKITQANALAVAISGPFAPVVAPLLMIAWALAESVIDTADLLMGKEVLVFKQGADWSFSLEGGIKKVVGFAVDYAVGEIVDVISEKIDAAGNMVSTATNKAVYDAYQMASKPAAKVDDAVQKAQRDLTDWSGDMTSSIRAGNSTAGTEFQNVATEALNTAFTNLPSASETINQTKDQVLLKIDKGITGAEKKLKSKTKEMAKNYGDQFSEWASDGLEKYFRRGNPISTGSSSSDSSKLFTVKMDYLDYMRIFLMFYGNDYKVKRIQELIQANIRYGAKALKISSHEKFSMETAYTNISATMDTSINYMFMSNVFLPDSLRLNGRMKVSVSTDRSY